MWLFKVMVDFSISRRRRCFCGSTLNSGAGLPSFDVPFDIPIGSSAFAKRLFPARHQLAGVSCLRQTRMDVSPNVIRPWFFPGFPVMNHMAVGQNQWYLILG